MWADKHFFAQSVSWILYFCFFLFLDEFSVLGHAGDPGMDWEYFSLSGHIQPELLAHSDGTVELIIMVSLVDAIGIPV